MNAARKRSTAEPNETCPVCRQEFLSTGRRYCSTKCADAAWAQQHPNVPVRRPGRHRESSDLIPPDQQKRGK